MFNKKHVNVLIKTVLLLLVFIFIGYKALVLLGADKVPGFLMPLGTQAKISENQKKMAVSYFSNFPFVLQPCVEKYFSDKNVNEIEKHLCLISLASIDKPWVISMIWKRLNNADADLRMEALDALDVYYSKNLMGPEEVNRLIEQWKNESDPMALVIISRLVSQHSSTNVISKVKECINFESVKMDYRKKILGFLWLYKLTKNKKELGVLIQVLKAGDIKDRKAVVSGAWILLKFDAKPLLLIAKNDKNADVRNLANKYLREL